jgi:hypothetical protein
MKTSDILLGVAVLAVGVIVWRSVRPAEVQAPAPTSSGSGLSAILGGAAGALASLGAERFGEAARGERDWW